MSDEEKHVSRQHTANKLISVRDVSPIATGSWKNKTNVLSEITE